MPPSTPAPDLASVISAERALIFRITHVANVAWILAHGLHCLNGTQQPDFVTIGNAELIGKRAILTVPVAPGGTLADYVPFYFTPKSPMLMNIHTGYRGIPKHPNEDIAILVSSVPTLISHQIGFLFTDRHAVQKRATYLADPQDLATRIDWDVLRRSDFRRSDEDPEKIERYQAEALVHRHLPVSALLAVACVSERVRASIAAAANEASRSVQVIARPSWYFG